MKRRHFFGTLTSGLVGSTLATSTGAAQETKGGGLTRTPLAIMAPRPDGFEAVWAVTRLSRGKVEWEDDDGGRGEVASDSFGFVPQGDEILRVRVAGLRPGRKYRVRAVTTAAGGGAEETTAWKTVRTLDPEAASTEFVVWNDTHIHNDTIQKLHEVTPEADFLLWNGDTCNDWTRPELLVPTLLHPGERDITDGRGLMLTFGNHDVRGPHAFRVPEMVATPTGRPFHAFRSGPVAVICLHTGEDKPDDHPSFGGRVAFDELRREQAEWLAETIQRPEFRDAPYRVVFCHIPLRWLDEGPQDYARGGFDRHSGRSRAAWHDSLVAWKTQVVISGHTHHAAWLPPTEEFPYGQITGGGPQMQSATWMAGSANGERLEIRVRNLEGKVLHEVTVPPVGAST